MPKSCPRCNQSNPGDAAFCLNCSTPLAQGPTIGAPPHQQWGGQQNMAGSASSRAVTSLILGAAGLLCCGLLTGIPAAIVGWMELGAIKSGQAPAAGKWMAMVGLWGGIAASVIHLGIWIVFGLMGMISASNPYGY